MKNISPMSIIENRDSREAYFSIVYRLSDMEFSPAAIELSLGLLIEDGVTFGGRKDMVAKCSSLYGMTYDSSFIHREGYYYVTFRISSVDEAYVKTRKKLRNESLVLLRKVLQNGIRQTDEVLLRLKNDLNLQLTDLYSSPSFKALFGIYENIIPNFYPGEKLCGPLEKVQETSFAEINKVLAVFKNGAYVIAYLGRKDGNIESKIRSVFQVPTTIECRKSENIVKPETVSDFTADTAFPQSILAIIYGGTPADDERSSVIQSLASAILINSATSRLYQKIREELHLVYDISATKFSSVYIITAPLKSLNYQMTLSAVKKTVDHIKRGISEVELLSSKHQFKQTLIAMQSTPSAAIEFITSSIQLSYSPHIEDYLSLVDEITKNEVEKYLQSLEFFGSYFVKGTGE